MTETLQDINDLERQVQAAFLELERVGNQGLQAGKNAARSDMLFGDAVLKPAHQQDNPLPAVVAPGEPGYTQYLTALLKAAHIELETLYHLTYIDGYNSIVNAG